MIGARRQPIGTSPGTIGTAVGQQHLRQILGILGSLVVDGEAYISFRPELIDSDQNSSIEDKRKFLRQRDETVRTISTQLINQ